MSILLTALRGLWSKAGLYLISIGTVLLALLSAFRYVSRSSKDAEKLDQAQAQIKTQKKAQKIEADIDRMSAAARRKRLLDRWSKR